MSQETPRTPDEIREKEIRDGLGLIPAAIKERRKWAGNDEQELKKITEFEKRLKEFQNENNSSGDREELRKKILRLVEDINDANSDQEPSGPDSAL